VRTPEKRLWKASFLRAGIGILGSFITTYLMEFFPRYTAVIFILGILVFGSLLIYLPMRIIQVSFQEGEED